MARWAEIEREAPELAARAREIFEAHKHQTIATLRRDGSPRISGTEAAFDDGELWFGSMPGAVKALDLRRDSRFALHSTTADESMALGDAKVAGRAEEVDDAALKASRSGSGSEYHLFHADITEVVVTRVAERRLLIESWHPGRGVERRERD